MFTSDERILQHGRHGVFPGIPLKQVGMSDLGRVLVETEFLVDVVGDTGRRHLVLYPASASPHRLCVLQVLFPAVKFQTYSYRDVEPEQYDPEHPKLDFRSSRDIQTVSRASLGCDLIHLVAGSEFVTHPMFTAFFAQRVRPDSCLLEVPVTTSTERMVGKVVETLAKQGRSRWVLPVFCTSPLCGVLYLRHELARKCVPDTRKLDFQLLQHEVACHQILTRDVRQGPHTTHDNLVAAYVARKYCARACKSTQVQEFHVSQWVNWIKQELV
jgi:hypothetical protein